MSRWHRENPDYLETGMQPPDPRDAWDMKRKRQKEEGQEARLAQLREELAAHSARAGVMVDPADLKLLVPALQEVHVGCGNAQNCRHPACRAELRVRAAIEEDRLNRGD